MYDVELNFLLRLFTEFEIKKEDIVVVDKPTENELYATPVGALPLFNENKNDAQPIADYKYNREDSISRNKTSIDFCSTM